MQINMLVSRKRNTYLHLNQLPIRWIERGGQIRLDPLRVSGRSYMRKSIKIPFSNSNWLMNCHYFTYNDLEIATYPRGSMERQTLQPAGRSQTQKLNTNLTHHFIHPSIYPSIHLSVPKAKFCRRFRPACILLVPIWRYTGSLDATLQYYRHVEASTSS